MKRRDDFYDYTTGAQRKGTTEAQRAWRSTDEEGHGEKEPRRHGEHGGARMKKDMEKRNHGGMESIEEHGVFFPLNQE